MHHTDKIFSALALAALASVLAGCGAANPVTGAVTYDGQPVAKGSITFVPADGKGPSSGGAIENGRYSIEDVPPGEKIVQIVELPDVPVVRTTEELAQQAKTGGGQAPPKRMIPNDAIGNNAKVTVSENQGPLDFHLKPPAQ